MDANNVTTDTFYQSPVTTNTQINNAETLKGLTLHSTINDSAYYNLDEDDAESDPKSDPLVDNHTSDGKKRKLPNSDTINRNSPRKLLIN